MNLNKLITNDTFQPEIERSKTQDTALNELLSNNAKGEAEHSEKWKQVS